MTYEYNATVVRLLDGDTLEVNIDLGFQISFRQIIRLYGINTPERNTREGTVSLARLHSLIPPGTQIKLHTLKDRKEKYGRYLGIIYIGGMNVAAQLIHEKLANEYYP